MINIVVCQIAVHLLAEPSTCWQPCCFQDEPGWPRTINWTSRLNSSTVPSFLNGCIASPLICRETVFSPSFSEERIPQFAFLSVHIFWACFPVSRLPLAPPGVSSADSSLSLTYFSAALLQRATISQQTEAPRQTGAVHGELDGLSLLREEIETDHRVTVPTISISLPPGKPTIVSHLSRLLSAEYGSQLTWMFWGKSVNKRVYRRNPIISATDLSTNSWHISVII